MEKLGLKLELEVRYNLNGGHPEMLEGKLRDIVSQAMREGQFTGTGPAYVLRHDYKIVNLTERERLAADLEKKAEDAGLTAEDLDEMIHNMTSSMASGVNNGGLVEQFEFAIQQLGPDAEPYLTGIIQGLEGKKRAEGKE